MTYCYTTDDLNGQVYFVMKGYNARLRLPSSREGVRTIWKMATTTYASPTVTVTRSDVPAGEGTSEGERAMTQDSNLLVKFHLERVPQTPCGVFQIDVTSNIDTNGILGRICPGQIYWRSYRGLDHERSDDACDESETAFSTTESLEGAWSIARTTAPGQWRGRFWL